MERPVAEYNYGSSRTTGRMYGAECCLVPVDRKALRNACEGEHAVLHTAAVEQLFTAVTELPAYMRMLPPLRALKCATFCTAVRAMLAALRTAAAVGWSHELGPNRSSIRVACGILLHQLCLTGQQLYKRMQVSKIMHL